MDAVSSCVRLCVTICEQLGVAKYNKKQCHSLQHLVSSVRQYLQQIPSQELTPAGQTALGRLKEVLQRAHLQVSKFVQMSALVAILLAKPLQEKFMVLRSDLMDTFNLMCNGEGLARAVSHGMPIKPVDLPRLTEDVLNNIMAEQELRYSRMETAAKVAINHNGSPESIQQVLLQQLKGVEGLDSMTPEDLAAELEELQVAALCGLDGGKTKPFGSRTEEFLVEQLCKALQDAASLQNPRQSASASASGVAAAAAAAAAHEAPRGFICPISLEIMVKPVILAETGQTFERACIEEWLDANNTCPVTHRTLTVKPPQLIINYSLQQSIEDWAATHGVRLPPAPVYTRPFDMGPPCDLGYRPPAATTNSIIRSSTAAGSSSSSSSTVTVPAAGSSSSSSTVAGSSNLGYSQAAHLQMQPRTGDLATAYSCKRTLNGHQSSVDCCAISPDRRTLVSGSMDKTLKVWDLGSGSCKQTLNGHMRRVCCCAISPDGRTLVSGSMDDTLKVWDLNTGSCKQTLNGHRGPVYCCAISADGRTLVSGSGDKTLKVWDLGSNSCKRTLNGHKSSVDCCAISPDGRTLVSGSWDKTLKVWDLGSGSCKQTLNGHKELVYCCAISPDGCTLVSGSRDDTLKVWDLGAGSCKQTVTGHQRSVFSCAISPDGRTLVSGSGDNTLKVWDLGSGSCKQTVNGHRDTVSCCSISPDGRTLVSGSWDTTLLVWDLNPSS